MFMLIYFIFVVATSDCFDLGLDGDAYLDSSMNNSLNFSENRQNKESFLRNDVNISNQNNDDKIKLVSKINDHLDIFGKNKPYSPVTEDPGLLKSQFENEKTSESFRSDLLDLKKLLSNVIKKINNIDSLGIDNSPKFQILLDNATQMYTDHFNAYFNKINETLPKSDLDRELVILDLIETTNHLLFETAKKIMLPIRNQASFTSYDRFNKLQNIILNEKKQAFKYACEKIQVCRRFRGFVDKMADLINEILILYDAPYYRVINDMIKAIERKHWFLRKITTAETRNALQLKLASWKNDPEFLRELLTTMQTVIKQRYKLFNNSKPEMKVKIKAVRILLDLIDKAFPYDDEDFFTLELDTTISSITDWAQGLSNSNINPHKLVNRIVEMLNYQWGSNTKEDVKVLIELIVFGTTRNEYIYEELFAKGAYNRPNDENEIHSDSE